MPMFPGVPHLGNRAILSESGSIEGMIRNIGQAKGRVRAAMEKIAASYCEMPRSKYFQMGRSGVRGVDVATPDPSPT